MRSSHLGHAPDSTSGRRSHLFSLPQLLFLRDARFLTASRTVPFSVAHFPFRLIPASGSFASSAFPIPPLHYWVPSHKAAARFGSRSPRFWVPQKNGAEKGENSGMSYLYVVHLNYLRVPLRPNARR